MTRIAIFADTHLGPDDDAASVLDAAIRHAPEDLKAQLLTLGDLPVETEDCFTVSSFGISLPWGRRRRVFWPRLGPFARQLRAGGAEIVHVATPGPAGLVGRYLARRLKLPVVGSVHAPLATTAGALGASAVVGLSDRLTRWAYDGCETILAPSRATGAWLTDRGFANVTTMGAGVDANCFDPGRASPGLRQAWHVDPRRPAIVIPISPLTRPEVAAIGLIGCGLHRHALAYQLVFVGENRTSIDLQELCPDGVFVGDGSDNQLAIVLASADVCLFLGASDAPGGGVLKAQASGLPVIVPDAGGAMECIIGGRTGYVTRAGDVDGIVLCLSRLLRNAKLRADMARMARSHALDRTWPAMLKPLHQAWREAAVSRRSAPACPRERGAGRSPKSARVPAA